MNSTDTYNLVAPNLLWIELFFYEREREGVGNHPLTQLVWPFLGHLLVLFVLLCERIFENSSSNSSSYITRINNPRWLMSASYKPPASASITIGSSVAYIGKSITSKRWGESKFFFIFLLFPTRGAIYIKLPSIKRFGPQLCGGR